MLIPSENRERAAMFDFAAQTAHEALTLPDVTERLGALASDLEIVNKTLFLPDYRNGAFHVPPSYEHEPSVALVPLPDNVFEFEDLHKLVKPIFDQPIRAWPFATAFTSKAYDLDLTREANKLIKRHGRASDPALTGFGGTTKMEAFTWYDSACLPKQKLYVLSRPVIVLRYSTLLQENTVPTAATVVHEESHALDRLVEGPMAGLLKFAAAGELRACHVDSSVSAGYGEKSTDEVMTIEDLRLVENADAPNPFRPTGRLVDFLLKGDFL